MSLINDALKKAQKQRTGEMPTLHSMPSVGGESAQHIARRSKPAGVNTLLIRAGIAGGLALVIGIGAYVALGRKAESGNRKPEESKPAASGTASAPATPAPSPASQPAAAQAPVTFTLKTEPVAKTETAATKPEPVAQKVEPKPSAPAPTPKVAAATPAPVAEPPKPAAKLEPRAIEYIENLKVAGIRASATDPKVLMNDRVYRPGSTVNAEMSLKLAEITASSLTFEDDHGGRYTRTF